MNFDFVVILNTLKQTGLTSKDEDASEQEQSQEPTAAALADSGEAGDTTSDEDEPPPKVTKTMALNAIRRSVRDKKA